MSSEIILIDPVEAPEIARIVQPDANSHHVLDTVAGLFQDGQKIADRLVRLGNDVAAMISPFSIAT